MGLLSELRRRNVIRTMIAYVAGSWLLVQVASIVLPTFDVEPWVMRALIVVLALGLPVVVVLAWLYDLTPEGMKRTSDEAPSKPVARPLGRKIDFVIIALLSLALSAMLVTQYVPTDVARLGARSLIVLPFATNQDEEGSLLADGLLGEILTQLYKIDGLKTIGRATAMYYEGTDKPIGVIAEEVGVRTVLAGNIIEAEEVARLNVELMEAQSGEVLWGESYELSHTVRGLFRIQSDIATRIANALEAELSPEEKRLLDEEPVTTDAAYAHYLRGEAYRLRTHLQEAMEAYEQAVAADPEFATAWVALADVRAYGNFLGIAETTHAEAEFALEQARRLAPDSVDTLFAEALFDEVGGNERLRRVLELRPGHSRALLHLCMNYTVALQLDKARELAARAIALDPMNIEATWQLGFIEAWAWNFTEAKKYYDRVLALEGDAPHAWRFWMRYNVYLHGFGDLEAARRILDEAPPAISTKNAEVTLAWWNRDFSKAQELLDAMEGDEPAHYVWQALLARRRGDLSLQRESAEKWRVSLERRLESKLARGVPSIVVEEIRSMLASAHALAGNEAEALRLIALAVERVADDPDRLNASFVNQQEVQVYMLLGQTDTAIERLREMLSWVTPQNLTPMRLRMDPGFDVLRSHPEFTALIEEADTKGK